jgi:hypothetical protein
MFTLHKQNHVKIKQPFNGKPREVLWHNNNSKSHRDRSLDGHKNMNMLISFNGNRPTQNCIEPIIRTAISRMNPQNWLTSSHTLPPLSRHVTATGVEQSFYSLVSSHDFPGVSDWKELRGPTQETNCLPHVNFNVDYQDQETGSHIWARSILLEVKF